MFRRFAGSVVLTLSFPIAAADAQSTAAGSPQTIQAIQLDAPLKIDGRLDEAVYADHQPVSNFTQMEPLGGAPASQRTDVWVLFDRDNVYVTMRAFESRPDLMVANEMRRDSANIRQGDSLAFSFDTFRDLRNAFQFEVNPLGARTDGQSTNERQYNSDWNPVWDVATATFDGGWTMEAAVPFKSLRYGPGQAQVWGFNARRTTKWKNEIAFLAPIPPSFGIGRGSFAASLFPTLVGIQAPPSRRNLEIKPYAVGNVTTDRAASPAVTNDPDGDVGVDAKYGITQGITADVTYNTDFAQVEADEQQVNLTRFSLFFPEKRDFFLENQGTFAFAASGTTNQSPGDVPLLFYSRRIGLDDGQSIPILAGGRVSGRAGAYSIGALDIGTREQDDTPSTNFSVVRLKRDILRRSSIGAMATSRSDVSGPTSGAASSYGVDATFAFFSNLAFNTYWAKTDTPGLDGGESSYRAQMEYAGDRYGLVVDRLIVGRAFNPEVGYVRRRDIRESYLQGRFSPRPASMRSVRKLPATGTLIYVDNGAGERQSSSADGEFAVEFQNSDRFSVGVTDSYERLTRPFPIVPGVTIPIGEYDFTAARVVHLLGQQRPVSGTVSLEAGEFYDGHRMTVSYSRSRVNVSSRFSLEPNISVNRVTLPAGDFTARLYGSRVTYTATPLMFVSALVQYNSSTERVSANVRLRWEYRPGSELFVVYNDERDTHPAGVPQLQNRSVIVKINRLFRF